MKRPRAAERLHPKIHGIDYEQLGSAEPHLGRIIKLSLAGAGLANGFQHAALHVHDKNLVAQGVGYVDTLLSGVDRDPSGAFEESFPTFQGADHPTELSPGVKYENLSRKRVGHVDVVLRIHGNALRRQHRILAAVFAGQEFVLLFREVENMYAVRPGVGDDDPPARIGGDAVGSNQKAEVGLARDGVDDFRPETALRVDFALQAEAALKREFAAAFEQQLRRGGLARGFLGLLSGPSGQTQQRDEAGSNERPVQLPAPSG